MFFEKVFLLLQRCFRLQPHPFNEEREGRLNYSYFEYRSAPLTFDLFARFGDVKKMFRRKKILDVACGGGGKSVWIAEHGASRVVGIDLEPLFVQQANEFAVKHRISDTCEFVLADASKLPFEDNSFDIAVLNDVMEHVDHPEAVLRDLSRVLKSGGQVLINVEPYYHPNGSHMMDVFTMPWNHVFFSEKFRIKMYKKMVTRHADAADRIAFRFSQDDKGEDYVGYLNKMTMRRYEKLLLHTFDEYGFEGEYLEQKLFNRQPFFFLGHLPFFREFFTRYLVVVLKKK